MLSNVANTFWGIHPLYKPTGVYSSNKIRKTQNEHQNKGLSKFEQSVIVNIMPVSWLLGDYNTFFALETIKVSQIIMGLANIRKKNHFWQENKSGLYLYHYNCLYNHYMDMKAIECEK